MDGAARRRLLQRRKSKMNDIFDFINELKELQILYNSNDIRNYDFEIRIKKLERIVEKFEIQMFEEVDA